MKNYYDELEVSKTASKEVIEKVYKVLAKKYHPDTTKEIDKFAAEEKFKIISEAYEILSDDEKRKKYDLELEQSNPTISYQEYMNVVKQRDFLNKSLNELQNKFNNIVNSNSSVNNTYSSQTQQYNKTNNNYYYTNPTTSQRYSTSNNQTYTTNIKKKLSIFDYLIYKIKNFFYNLLLLLLSIIISIIIINIFSKSNLLDLYKIF